VIFRNPILVSYVAKGLLPYRGLGSGIKRALAEWPEIRFTDDRDGSMFIATVRRKGLDDIESAEKGSQKSSQKIIELMRNDPKITVANLALHIGIRESDQEADWKIESTRSHPAHWSG